jgi:hypothetical protein
MAQRRTTRSSAAANALTANVSSTNNEPIASLSYGIPTGTTGSDELSLVSPPSLKRKALAQTSHAPTDTSATAIVSSSSTAGIGRQRGGHKIARYSGGKDITNDGRDSISLTSAHGNSAARGEVPCLCHTAPIPLYHENHANIMLLL